MTMLSMNKNKQRTEEQFGISFLQSNAFRAISPRSGYFVKELETTHGRPDVVVIGSDGYDSSSPVWQAAQASPSTIIFSKVLITMKASKKSMSIEAIMGSIGVSEAACRATIRALETYGLIVYLKNGNLKLSERACIPDTEITSIEFKLHDWQKALKQAARHKSFADKAYIVMPMCKKTLLQSRTGVFSRFGVSVLVYDDLSESYEVIYDAQNTKKLSECSYIDVLGRLFTNSETLSPIEAI